MTKTPARSRLACCEPGKIFAGLMWDGDFLYGHDTRKSYFAAIRSTPPQWRMTVEPVREGGNYTWTVAPPIVCCPFCGTRVPELRLRKNPPKRITVITDGGYYCDTCTRRLNECRCHLPTRLWESKP